MKKYYDELKNTIDNFISDEKYEKALKLINEELSMPYIPMEFEEFLINRLAKIPSSEMKETFTLSLEKVIDLLIQLDENSEPFIELVNHLSKFNLRNNKEEIEYYFSKSKNKNYRIHFFDLLCEEGIDIELEYGNPSKIQSISSNKNYLNDKEELVNKLDKFPSLVEPAMNLLKDMYLPIYIRKSIDGNYSDLVLYTLSKIFKQNELALLVKDYNKMKKRLENFKSIDNL